MGTTLAALQGDEGVAYQWVLAIEGFECLVTDGDTTAAETAWAATPWDDAIGGLFVDGNFEQTLDPWNPINGGGDLTFVVRDTDGADILGKRIFKRSGTETTLTATADNNDTTLTMQSTTGLTGADVYIGVERVGFSGSTGTTLTGCDRGKYSPFNRDGATDHEFGRYHRLSDSGLSANVRPLVSNVPRVWSGKWVGLWLHRKVAGVLDVKAEAQLVFAGKLADIRENESGDVVISAAHVLDAVAEATVMDQQFRITFAEGITLNVRDQRSVIAEIRTWNGSAATSRELTVVTSGPGTYSIVEGRYSYQDLVAVINRMLSEAAGLGHINVSCNLGIVDSGGPRVEFSANFDGTGQHATLRLDHRIAVLFGLSGAEQTQAIKAPDNAGITIEVRSEMISYQVVQQTSEDRGALVGALAPYRVLLLASPERVESGRYRSDYYAIGYTDYEGEIFEAYDAYFDQFGRLNLADGTEDTGSRFLLSVDGYTFLCTWTTGFGDPVLNIYPEHQTIPAGSDKPYTTIGLRDGEEGDLVGTQTLALTGDMATVYTAILASTPTTGYNHSTYDKGIAGPAVPWEIMSGVAASLQQLQAINEPRATIIVDKPTTVKELLSVELVLRRAYLVWRNGTLLFTTWATPIDADDLPSLTEANKSSSNQADKQITIPGFVDQWVRNIVKVEYDRVIGTETYQRTVIAEDAASLGDLGRQLPITLKARNAFSIGSNAAGVQRIESILPAFIGWLPVVSRPVLQIRRTIDFSLFEGFGVGSIVKVTDNFVRDPGTGDRGIADLIGIVVGHRYSYGGADPGSWESPRPIFGEVDVVIMGAELLANYCPAAEVDDTADSGGFTDGWNSGTSTLRTIAQKYQNVEAYDASYFAVGDEIQVIQIDPDPGATVTPQNATITAISTRDITLDASVTLTSGLRYRLIPRKYADCTTSQRANRAFVCDETDGFVQGLRRGLMFGAPPNGNTTTAIDIDDLAVLTHEAYSDEGMPLDVGSDHALVQTHNNLIGHRAMLCNPQMLEAPEAGGSVAANMVLLFPMLAHALVEDPAHSVLTRLVIAPAFRSTSGATATVTITVSQFPPRSRSDGTSLAAQPRWLQPFRQWTWTTTDTSVAERAQEIVDLRDFSTPDYPFFFVAVELFGADCEFHGLPTLYFLPPEF
jgi:hypothetical protein